MPTTDRMEGTDAAQRRVADRYLLRRRIGVGGMGVVWEALDELLARRVAIKAVELPATLVGAERAKFAARVLREARAAARLTHPAAVTLYDVIREQGTTYIVMELVEARSLAALVQEDGPLQPDAAARIGLQVLSALEVAHSHGIVHRDVKPGNVLVLPSGQAKLTDFGIATLRGDPELTTTGMVLGSPGYMSPEQASGEGSGPASDLYSLGATLFYAVEGQAPFGKAAPLPTMAAVVHEKPRPLRRAGALGPIIERLLAKEPDARPTIVEVRRFLSKVAAAQAAGSGPSQGAAPAVPVEREAPTDKEPATLEELQPVPAGELEPEPGPEPAARQAPAPEEEEKEEEPETQRPPEPERTPAPVPAVAERMREEPAGRPPAGQATGGLAEPPTRPAREAAPAAARDRRLPPLSVIGALLLAAVIGVMAVVATNDGGDGDQPSAAGGTAPTTVTAGTRGGGSRQGGGSPATTRPPTTTARPAPTTAAPKQGGGAPPGGGGTAAIPEGWRTFRASSGVYQLAYPGDWTVRTGSGRIIDFVRPGGGAYLRVDWTDQPQDPWENWKTYERQFAASHTGYERLRLEPGTFNGLRAALWEYRYRSGGTTLHAVNHTFVSRDGRFAYAFNFQTRESEWRATAGLRQELQRHFQVLGSGS